MAVLSDNLRGAAFMSGSMAAFTVNDTLIKALASDLPLFQAIFLRSALTCGLMLVLAWRLDALRFRFRRRDAWRIGVRTLTDVATAYFFLTALFHMPLANATAILQALPLTVTLAGTLFLGEAVGWRRLSAICVGLLGVLVIVKPGLEGFNVYSLYAVIAVLLVTVRDLVTRGLSADVPSFTIALINAMSVAVTFGLASMAGPWAPVSGQSWLLLAASAVAIILAYTAAVSAMRTGDLASVTPFRFTAMLWALVLGWLAFGDWPDAVTFLGAGLVVASGLYMFYRERQVAEPRHSRA